MSSVGSITMNDTVDARTAVNTLSGTATKPYERQSQSSESARTQASTLAGKRRRIQ